jgi:predicted permease
MSASPMPRHFIQDVRHGLRVLAAKPGFALAVVLTLALGIGANTAIFSVINGLLLKPLPYPDSARLVYIYNSYSKMSQETSGMTVPDYLDRREQADALADSALYYDRSFNLAEQDEAQHLVGIVATPSLFTTLQVHAALGRTFTADEAQLGREHVAVLSHALWKNQFNADAAIVGHDIRLNGEAYRVVGVMPGDFGFPNHEVQVWTAFAFTPKQMTDAMRGFGFAESIGRLKSGATLTQLDAQFDQIVQNNVTRFAALGTSSARSYEAFIENSGFRGRGKLLHDELAGDIKPLLWLLQAAVVAVLLIACANVANLMLLRISSRQKELALRSALGAGHMRLAQQLVVESLLLALTGGAAGIFVALACIRLIHGLGLDGARHGFSVDLDGSVLAFTLISTLLVGLLFGLAPLAMIARARPADVLKQGARGSVGSHTASRLRNGLVIVQITFAVILLAGAGLLIHSFALIRQQNPGFNSDDVISATVHLPVNRYKDSYAATPFYERLLAGVRALPGVQSASVTNAILFVDDDTSAYFIEGRDVSDAQPPPLGHNDTIDEDYFRTLQIPLLRGREFLTSDDVNAPKVVIVDELFARKFFPGESVLGKRIAMRDVNNERIWQTIVGEVATVKRNKLYEDTRTETIYSNFSQNPTRVFNVVMKTRLVAAELIGPLQAILQTVDPEQAVFDIKTMHERIDSSLDDRRTPMLLLMLFAGVALALSAIGIYGVLAFSVASRTGELGVRMSIGASRSDILKLVLVDGARLAGLGLAIGLAGSLALSQLMKSQLFGVGVVDPLALVSVVVVLAMTALLACYFPARRAASVDPIEALRQE